MEGVTEESCSNSSRKQSPSSFVYSYEGEEDLEEGGVPNVGAIDLARASCE